MNYVKTRVKFSNQCQYSREFYSFKWHGWNAKSSVYMEVQLLARVKPSKSCTKVPIISYKMNFGWLWKMAFFLIWTYCYASFIFWFCFFFCLCLYERCIRHRSERERESDVDIMRTFAIMAMSRNKINPNRKSSLVMKRTEPHISASTQSLWRN